MSVSENSYYGPTALVSFLLGAFAGATAVLLLAPKARRESAERMRELSHDLKERASATIDTAKDRLSSVVSRGKDVLNEKRSVIESAVEAGKEAYVQGKNRAAQGDRPLV